MGFAANNQLLETTHVSPFFANDSFGPAWNNHLESPTENSTADSGALTIGQTLADIHEHVKTEMKATQLTH
jgi:hypothetical protein